MSAADIAAIIARDPALSTLAVVLDEARRNDALGGPSVVNRLRYKPGSSIVASVTTVTEEGERTGWIAAYRDAVKVDKTLTRAARAGFSAQRVPGLVGVVVGETSADRQLARALADVRAHQEPLFAQATVLRHNPHRRVIFRTTDRGVPVALKVSAADSAVTAATATARQLAADLLESAGVPVIRPIPCGNVLGAETVRWWGDGDLTTISSLEASAEAARAAGHQLALLHLAGRSTSGTSAAAASDAATSAAAISDADSAAHVIGTILPREGARAARVNEMLRRTGRITRATAQNNTLVHGDFSADQVLVTAGAVRLIDFDRARRDLPERDLGSFLATADLTGRADLGAPLLAGYTDAGASIDDHELRRATAQALLQRSVEPFRGLMPDWADRTSYALHRAEQELGAC